MKVLFLCGGDHKYGTPRMAISLIEQVIKTRPDITFIVLTSDKGSVNDQCDELGIENHVIPYKYCVYKKEPNRIADALKRILKGILICRNLSHSIRLIERYVDIDSIDLIHTNINRDLLGECMARKYHIPHIVHLRELYKAHFGLSLLFPDQVGFMNRYTNRFVAVSDTVMEDWRSFGFDGRKMATIYDGVDADDVKCRITKTVSTPIKVVMCGGIYVAKGQRQLVEAIHILKDKGFNVQADFFGDEEGTSGYYGTVMDDIKQYNLGDCVHMRGYQKDVRKRICDYDIGVVCSKAEGFGLVTVEYMLAGLCPVVSDTGANEELVQDGESGLVYRWGDSEDLAEKIAGLLQDHDKLLRLSKNAHTRALERFSLKASVERLTDLYDEVCQEPM